jgi:hypothetical protein
MRSNAKEGPPPSLGYGEASPPSLRYGVTRDGGWCGETFNIQHSTFNAVVRNTRPTALRGGPPNGILQC